MQRRRDAEEKRKEKSGGEIIFHLKMAIRMK
jgi:hypothetical protein